MMYRILGRFSVGPHGDQPQLARLPQAVFAVLLLNANHIVATRDLLERVWNNADIDETQLQKQIHVIRSLLEGFGRRDDLVTRHGAGYELRVAPDDLDLFAFDRHLNDARTAGNLRSKRDHLRAALTLWDGQRVFGGAADVALRGADVAIEARRRQAAVQLAAIDLGFGDVTRAVTDLQVMAAYYPTDTRICELLMIALFRDECVLEGVESVYRFHVAELDRRFGHKPMPRLTSLLWAIRRQDRAYVDSYQVMTGPRVPPRQLPPDPADFVGRDKDVGELTWLLTREQDSTPPVLVIAGAGGIGKTSLAVHVAHLVRHEFPDGQFFLELGGNTARPIAPGEVLAWILRALGVSQVPASIAERRAAYRTHIAGRRMLLILDDAADEAQVADLIPGDTAPRILVTTRTRVANLPGSVHHLSELAPLTTDDSVKLFERVIERTAVPRRLDASATVRVATLCEGLPLAIVIAASVHSRNPARSTEEFADLLEQQPLERLEHADRSVARTIGAGVERLPPGARRLFRGLGLLRFVDFGRWTAAAVLAGTDEDPDTALDALAGCHLLQADASGRYRFHGLTQRYAHHLADRECDGTDRSDICEAVYGTLLTGSRHAHCGLYGGDFEIVHSDLPNRPLPRDLVAAVTRDPFRWFDAERTNIRRAVEHTAALGLTALCWDLAITTHEFHNVRGHLDDWLATQVCALHAARAGGDMRGEAAMLTALGQSTIVASRRAGVSGPHDVEKAVHLFESAGDRHGLAMALRTLANFRRRAGELAEAIDLFQQAMDAYVEVEDALGHWQALRYIGQCHLERGAYDLALRALRAAGGLAERLDRPRPRAQNAYWLGRLYLELGDRPAAHQQFKFVIDAVGGDDAIGRAHALHGLGDLALLREGPATARRFLLTALDVVGEAGGDAVLEGRIHLSLADACELDRDPAGRNAALRNALVCFDSGGADRLRESAARALGGGGRTR